MRFKDIKNILGVNNVTGNSAVMYIECGNEWYATDVKMNLETHLNEFYASINQIGKIIEIELK